ncbi:MAG: TolC family protein [Polyangiaceae bacterium]
MGGLLAREVRAECGTLTRANVVTCAWRANPSLEREAESVRGADARVLTESPLLPSNPVLTATLARRVGPGGTPEAVNWTASLAQEVAVAGQRGLRRDAVENELEAARNARAEVTKRAIARAAWGAYFGVLAARDEVALVRRMEAAGAQSVRATRERADRGLVPALDAQLADVAQSRLVRDRFALERDRATSLARLAAFVGSSASNVDVRGDLVPLAGAAPFVASTAGSTWSERPEAKAFAADARAWTSRADAFRRARVPNPTLSAFVQNDGFDEKVLGLGVGLPIPLPGLGRTNRGEIAESEAAAARARAAGAEFERDARAEFDVARAEYASRMEELSGYTADSLARADKALSDLAIEIAAGRIGVRDALLAQERLVEFLRAAVDARHAACVASVALVAAGNGPLERGEP